MRARGGVHRAPALPGPRATRTYRAHARGGSRDARAGARIWV